MLRSCKKLPSCFLRGTRRPPWGSLRFQSSATSSISLGMLDRAKKIADEHAGLKNQLMNQYDPKIVKRIGELSNTTHAYNRWQESNKSLQELRQLLSDPDSDEELRSIAEEEIQEAAKDMDDASAELKSTLIPPHPFTHLPCLIEIRPGTGGSEAGLFAGDLLRMYVAFCRRHGLRTELVSLSSDEILGSEHISEAIMEIPGTGAYGMLRCEAGVHRVQRVPATETKGRVHTSTASVLVLPSFPDQGIDELDFNDPASDYYVAPGDVRTDVMRARGAGGQHVNTTDSAVRLTHMPTNTVVAVQTSRSQQQNRTRAWQILRARLAQSRREAREAEVSAVRRGIMSGGRSDRSDKIRTYNWGQRRVTEHRSGFTTHNLDEVLEGGPALDSVMVSVRAWMAEVELESLAAEEEAKQR